ncbi:MAG: hypothetical protein AB1480_16850 [Nitrospirota bacterium]
MINEDAADSLSLHAFMAYQLRNVAAHPSHMTFEDALFTFLSIFYAIEIDIAYQSLKWEDPCPSWRFEQDIAAQMISSFCNNACNESCNSYRKKNFSVPCKPSVVRDIEKAKFLSLEHNLEKLSVALNNQVFFRYLFYALCLKEMKQKIPEVVLPLIKSRLTLKHKGKFYPPFKDDCWVGIKMDDGSINSSLGILKSGMYDEKGIEGNKVLFHPTKRHLRVETP